MRNLKRALSLALASVMLLGMMVVGSSAATFSDEADIVNKEAVTITAGLGLFAGSDGKFNPKDTVTRAQMATIIVKMLYGSEINADQFKGAGTFSDTVAFEGGWAEGYVNLCASLNIVKGYGDGTFKPGQAVTTAEAVTMIINALKIDAGEGTWPMTVMAKAEEMKLFEDLAVKPGTNEGLSRDALAGIVLNGLNYSPSGSNTYTVTIGTKTFEFDNQADALAIALGENGPGADAVNTIPAEDTLAKTVFELKSETGFVVSNQATGDECTTIKIGPVATATVDVDLETGLDMIGHYVTVYFAEQYSTELKPGTAYCIVDEADYIVVAEDIDTKKDFTAAFGSSKALDFADFTMSIDGNYVAIADDEIPYLVEGDSIDYDAAAGTYVINSENVIVGYIANPTVYADEVTTIGTRAGSEYITIGNTQKKNTEDEDYIIEYDGIAEGDIVTYVSIENGENDIFVVTKAASIQGAVTKIATVDEKVAITVNGTVYVQSGSVIVAEGLLNDEPEFNVEYTIYVDAAGNWIGLDGTKAAANLSDVVYVKGVYKLDTTTGYGEPVTTTYAQVIDLEGKESQIIVDLSTLDEDEYDRTDSELSAPTEDNDASVAGFYTFEKAVGKAGKAGIMLATKLEETYDEDVKNIYVGTLETAEEVNKLAAKTVYVKDSDVADGDDVAFLTANTKFIVVEGDLQSTLSTAVTTGAITKNDVNGSKMILSVDADGNVNVEVMVIISDNLLVSSEEIIYVSADQIAAGSQIGDAKFEYNVYMVADGSVKEFVVDAAKTEAGFYTFEFDAEEQVYTLSDLAEGEIRAVDTYTGMIGEATMRTAQFATGINAANAYVVDTRTEEAIEADDSACTFAIQTLAELKAVAKDNTISFILFTDEDEENVKAIYITDIVAK